ncbi:alpha-2-macroglobulin-like protein 1 [Silurus meridionalis]|uniref:alpha-2-macroglobulin-like protein 1 n=1 Tax=Silurus meridionalis TaxID=175797 RepID=UPI001EEC310F|nr:alpha-2-macroglobulin-like protein 1 [Silurus meridionalis]
MDILYHPDDDWLSSESGSSQEVIPPATDRVVIPPESETDVIPPETEPDVIPPETEPDVIPPETETDVIPPESETDVILTETETDVIPPESETDVIPPESETDVILTESETDVIPTETETDVIPPETEPDVIPPETEPDVIPPETEPAVIPPESEPDVIPPETEPDVIPPESETDVILPESETDMILTETETDVIPPETETDVIPPESETDVIPIETETDVIPPQSETDVIPPETEPDVIPPETETDVIPPESETDVIPPETETDVIPPESEPDVIPPESETDVIPTESEPDVIPPETEPDVIPPETEPDVIPPESEIDVIRPESETDVIPPESEPDVIPSETEPDLIPPESETDVIPPETETDVILTENETDVILTESETDVILTESEPDVIPPETETDVILTETEPDVIPPETEPVVIPPESEPDMNPTEIETVLIHPETDSVNESVYLLAVTSQTVGGTTEMLCVTVNPIEIVTMSVTLEYNQNSVALLMEESVNQQYYRCLSFQVPVVTVELVASITIKIIGSKTFLNNATKILIKPSSHLTILQTDKPIYNPGQTVKFRVVSLDTDFLTYNQTDPNSNRIGQWLNVSTHSGLADLTYPINSEATKGIYIITVWDDKNQQIAQTFQVNDCVLPKFEVTVQLPPVITILDTTATLKVCAKCSYGKPVSGTVKTTVCQHSYRYGWQLFGEAPPPDICEIYTMKTDRSGCGLQILNLARFALSDMRYKASILVQSEVEEDGTGVIMTGSGSSSITSNIITLSFEDSPTTYKPGMTYEGKIKVLGPDAYPLQRKVVYLTVNYGEDKKSVRKLITSHKGVAKFSLNTEPWGLEQVNFEASYKTSNKPVVQKENHLIPNYPTADLFLQSFYSKSRSFIKFKICLKPFKCNKKAVIKAQYLIHHSALAPGQKTITFFYMVMSKGHLVQQGSIVEAINPEREEHRGNLALALKMMVKLSPVAQVVLYAILPCGEAVADSMNFPIQLCLGNKVSLRFSASQNLPGHQASLMLKAAPGSLCSVRAIDQRLLLMHPESVLNIHSVFNRLPVQELSGYPFITNEEESNPIWENFRGAEASKSTDHFWKVDVYNTFKDIGVKVLTNVEVKKPKDCYEDEDEAPALHSTEFSAVGLNTSKLLNSNCNYFPETWIWDLVPVSDSGAAALNKTVPDSITTWQAGAFCTSPVGFGVAPKTSLTAFQPFFVSLTKPCSVIHGEVFTLKATVISYIKSCMMVMVTLAESQRFSVQTCTSCTNTQCLCDDESWTISWTIKPLVLGEVNMSVTAEAVKSSDLCGGKAVTVPQQGSISSVIKSVQVQAEGTQQSKSYNELLCPSVEKIISLNLSDAYMKGSARASVSVLGDLMGRALQNLASLLAMPYGCGEQNMLRFAPNIFILEYLESTNQLTSTIRRTADTYLVSGYQQELGYKHTDGSYSAFGMNDASGNTWLTAFVMKSFGKAKQYIFVDQMFVYQAKTWLGNQQQANGCFASVGQLFHSDLKGGVNDEVTLSAYITAAMLELNYTVTDPVVDFSLTCLRNEYVQVKSTYAKALLFYTFTLAGDQVMRNILMLDLDGKAINSGGGRHWSREDGGSVVDSLEVEMTSYVLLALMCGPPLSGFDLGYSSSIVYWLSQQQNAFGGFASTQDTVVALQALAKYSLVTYSSAGTVTVTVTSPSGLKDTFNINQSNRLLYQESQLQELPGDYNIRAEGEGCVYVQFTLDYNIPLPTDSSSFTISASAAEDCKVSNSSLELTITVMYGGKRAKTNMVVIEVKPLSGFRVDETSVQLVTNKSDPTNGAVKHVDRIEGKANIYLNRLKKGEEKVYTLTIVQRHPVDNLKPAVVKVYDYYETGESAATSYTSPCEA